MFSQISGIISVAWIAYVNAHGMLVNPRPRNSIDYLVNVNDRSNKCSNITGDACKNGQARDLLQAVHTSQKKLTHKTQT